MAVLSRIDLTYVYLALCESLARAHTETQCLATHYLCMHALRAYTVRTHAYVMRSYTHTCQMRVCGTKTPYRSQIPGHTPRAGGGSRWIHFCFSSAVSYGSVVITWRLFLFNTCITLAGGFLADDIHTP